MPTDVPSDASLALFAPGKCAGECLWGEIGDGASPANGWLVRSWVTKMLLSVCLLGLEEVVDKMGCDLVTCGT